MSEFYKLHREDSTLMAYGAKVASIFKYKLHINQDFMFVALVCIIILASVLRFYELGVESYWIDEVVTVLTAQERLHQLATPTSFDKPISYYVPFHFWVKIFGTSEVATRSFSALIGIASVALIYEVGCKLFRKEIGILSSFLMSISEYQIYYSQETRYYNLFVFMTLLSFRFYIQALKTKKVIHFFLYILISILLIYSHAFGVFILMAQNFFLFFKWNEYRKIAGTWLICQAFIIFSIVPIFLPNLLHGVPIAGKQTPIGWIQDPSILEPLRSVYRFILPRRFERTWRSVLSSYVIGVIVFALGIGINIILKGKRKWFVSLRSIVANHRNDSAWGAILLLTCWLLCPIILPFFLSKVFGPMYLDRYVISAAPALYLLLAVVITSLRKIVPLLISIGVILIFITPGLHYYYVMDVKEQWREVASYIEANNKEGDIVVFAPSEDGMQQKSFDWYYSGSLPSCGLSDKLKDNTDIVSSLTQCTSNNDRLWVVMRGTSETVGRFRQFFLNSGYSEILLIDHQHFTGISVYLFDLPKQ
jgi:mannosyltransferase